ncbi:hypothetical protein ABTM44_17600 [Acinetobacter baumannii]
MKSLCNKANEFYQRLFKALSTDVDYKKAVQLRKEKSLNQKKKAKRLILKLLNKFSKLLVLRIDFSIHRDFKIPLELLKTALLHKPICKGFFSDIIFK